MPDFMDEAKDLAGEHSDLVDKGIEDAGQFADDKSGNKFDSQITDAEHQAEGFLDNNQNDQNN